MDAWKILDSISDTQIEIMHMLLASHMGMSEPEIRKKLKRKSSARPVLKKMIDMDLVDDDRFRKYPDGKRVKIYQLSSKGNRLMRVWA